MSLHSLSIRMGKALGLPEIFFKPLAFAEILDQKVKLVDDRPQRRRRKNVRKKNGSAANDTVPLTTVEGVLRPGYSTPFAVGELDIAITPATWIVGELSVGSKAKVRFKDLNEQHGTAHSIVVFQSA